MPEFKKTNSTIYYHRRRWQRVTAYFTLITCLFFSFGVSNLIAPSPVKAAAPSVTAVKASVMFAMVLKSDGTVWGWGANSYGQLGIGDTYSDMLPAPVQGLTNVKDIATGYFHTMALREDGTVWVWGNNDEGELGNGTSSRSPIPMQVPGLSNVLAIAAGSSHNLALTSNGTVWAWGNNANGRVGDGTTSNRYSPVQISGLTNVVSISAGFDNSYAITSDGSLWAWGRNNNGQIGDGTTTDRITPQRITSVNGVKSVAAATGVLALLTDGTVMQWGRVMDSEGNGISQLSPIPVPGLSGIISIATGEGTNLAVDSSHTPWMWGGTMIGDGTIVRSAIPKVVTALKGVTAVSTGGGYALAVLDNGSVWAWGISNYGALGNPSGNVQLIPFYHLVNETPLVPRVAYVSPLPGSPLYTKPVSLRAYFSRRIQIDTINSQNITLHDDSNNPVDFRMEPTQACVDIITTAPLQLGKTYTLKLSNFVDVYGTSMSMPYTYNFQVELPFPAWQSTVSAGAAHSLALLERVYAWGDNSSGQLGDGTTIGRTMPVVVQGLPNKVEFLAAGGGHNLAILPDGTVVAWGDNSAGQLGDGSKVNNSNVLPVPQLTDIVAVAAGTNHSLALKKDGTVWAWGANSSGQVGDGTRVDKVSPEQITGLSRIVYIAAGGDHSLAVTDEGSVLAWGNNEWGQLGDGSDSDRLAPVSIPNLAQVQTVAAGLTHSLALKKDGTVWAWGDNTQGLLGVETQEEYVSVPVQVPTLAGVTSVQAGYGFSQALRNDHTLMAWGGNYYNQLGDDSTDNVKTIPVRVPSLNNVTTMAAGGYHGLAMDDLTIKTWGFNLFGQLGNGLTEHASSPEETLIGQLPVSFRVAGQYAPDTAAQISATGWNYGSSTAIVVNERAYADALTGTVLAGALDAPVLLTNAKNLTPVTANELSVLNPQTVFILGGTAVVSAEIEQQLKKQYQTVIRIGGFDQYETSAKIARFLQEQHLTIPGKAVVAFGENFPDALAVSSLAAYQHIPILLTRTHSLPSYTRQALQDLNVTDTIVVGGNAVISPTVADLLPGLTRYWGMDKYDTAIAIAKGMHADTQTIFLATGENFPDALAGSVLAARTNSPIILVNKDLPEAAATFVRDQPNSQIKLVMVLGGTAVVPEEVLNSVGYNLLF